MKNYSPKLGTSSRAIIKIYLRGEGAVREAHSSARSGYNRSVTLTTKLIQ